jgi:LysM repeat protein
MLIKRGIEVLVGAALMLALLTVVPAVAKAQERGAAPARVVVSPGDSLWSISEEHLAPNATPRKIASEVERIYALNRDRIGPDPNLIFSGQEFSLPTAAGSSIRESATNKTAPAAQQIVRPARGTVVQDTAKSGRTLKGQISEQQGSLPNLPKVLASAAVPNIGSLARDAPPTSSPVISFQENMRCALTSAVRYAVAASVGTLAGVLVLTLIVCALIAWKPPIRRYTRTDEIDAWGIKASYPAGGYSAGGYHAYAENFLDYYGTTSVSVLTAPEQEPATNASKDKPTATEKGASPVGLAAIAQERRRQLTRRTSSKRLLPHNKRKRTRRRSVAKAHRAEARRLLRGAGLRRPATLEPRRSGRIKAARQVASGGGRLW